MVTPSSGRSDSEHVDGGGNTRGEGTMEYDLNTLERQIIELQIEHRDLDFLIDRMAAEPGHDELQLRRLKKRRLKLKDAITLLQLQLEPDVPA